MWWQAVFWILLIPLIIAEIIIFVRTKRFFWLVYALSIFTYVVAVSYTIDVFDLGRNGVILTLLASAVLMAATGWYLGKGVPKQKRLSRKMLYGAVALLAVMLFIFVVSVVFGRLEETAVPVARVTQEQLFNVIGERGPVKMDGTVVLLRRTLRNEFILPVPIRRQEYFACVRTERGIMPQQLFPAYAPQPEEVPPRDTVMIDVRFNQITLGERERVEPVEVLVYAQADRGREFYNCETVSAEPLYRIPVE